VAVVRIPAALAPTSVKRVGRWAVGNNGKEHFAVDRVCRHLGGPLDKGAINRDGCLVCPWHGAAYDVDTGRMVRGPQGFFAKVPGLGAAFKGLTAVLPLRRAKVEIAAED
jgi:nitrite reductase/ring-hydroxylating ferredoxin subunit